jgi:nitroimidazol reductase NimA-like FMN-containing flavoprotein (pyridoxamine 5'-phosphate oxidase superfamily)
MAGSEPLPDQRRTPQRRGRRISLTDEEVDTFLASARTCRLATSSAGGPHVSPLWFVWVDGAPWLYSIVSSQRFKDLQRDPRISLVVDDGHDYDELRGVEVSGLARVVAEVPRIGEESAELARVEASYAVKYQGRQTLRYDGLHAWVTVEVRKVVSWDFRKLPARSDDASPR